ncbi:Mannose-6-phosphate isomerase [Corynebacterium capitovis DSM 44611]|uniref:mannose-6-phosphate isomerase, class I n=1 Tax=Corynebacterium capitovis TaxID=131081 RepID=UPI00037C3D03|nr:mannose-6-phosphate isomerase, class I [Corynebacterium capitovis]WKD57030.1 Mannose-6-phosphate isomerase [Corynebacterium capitovis DSM 44611]
MQQLAGALRTYPWGSRSYLAQLLGEPVPSPRPEAELWFGAHSAAPSTIEGAGLDEIIAADPETALGERVRHDFGDGLPFLLKLLAADEPLSLQAHPSKAQAEEGFARENETGPALDNPRRNYKDPNHKPELIVALTEFTALAGFRPYALTQQLFDALRCPDLDRYTVMIDPAEEKVSLRALFTTWISIPSTARDALIASVKDSAGNLADDPGWMGQAVRNFLSLEAKYPGDVGALAALLLNLVTLEPGEGLFLSAGNLHAYMHGMGVEIMANSDNVLRGGLTSKHVDVPELVKVVDFSPLDDPTVETTPEGSGVRYASPCRDFILSRYDLAPGESTVVDSDGPAEILCTAGSARCEAGDLTPGSAVWVPAADGPATVSAGARGCQLFYARV